MTHYKLAAFLLALLPALSAQPNHFGLPACSGPEREFAVRAYFVLCHGSNYKVPLWVGYELTPDRLQRVAARPTHFRTDAQLARPGAHDADYRHSGYTRGHLAPAADFAWSDRAIRATFLLSNTVPQHGSANFGRWAQLESAIRKIAAASDAVYIFTGPIFDSPHPERIGPGRVAVPSHTFKVVLALRGGSKTMHAAIVPNTASVIEPLDHFTTTVAEVERRTGLDFFAELDDEVERLLEASPKPFECRR